MSSYLTHATTWSRRLTIALVLATLLSLPVAFLASQDAHAYVLLGGRWPNQPHSGCCATLQIYEAGPMQGGDAAGWDNDRNAWNRSPANIIYSSPCSGSCNITVTDTNLDNVAWDGVAYLYPNIRSTYTGAFLELNYFYTQRYSAAIIQSVAAHELGHLGGLDEANGCVLMNPTTTQRWVQCHVNTPQTDDVNGMNAIY